MHISWERIERISAITGSWKFDSKLEAHQRTNSRGGSDPARQESCLHDRTKLLSEDQLESLKTRRSDPKQVQGHSLERGNGKLFRAKGFDPERRDAYNQLSGKYGETTTITRQGAAALI